MVKWAQAAIDRYQTWLFHPTVDDMIGQDHPVRLFEELLLMHDWNDWEAEYD